jgi:hypothetical protein
MSERCEINAYEKAKKYAEENKLLREEVKRLKELWEREVEANVEAGAAIRELLAQRRNGI